MNKILFTLLIASSVYQLALGATLSDTSEEESIYKGLLGDLFAYKSMSYEGHSNYGWFAPQEQPILKNQYLKTLTHYFESLTIRGKYDRAFSIPTLFVETPKYALSPSGGFPVQRDLWPEVVEDVKRALIENIKSYSLSSFEDLLNAGRYGEALRFTEIYTEVFYKRWHKEIPIPHEHLGWGERTKILAMSNLKLSAQKIAALSIVDGDLAAEEQLSADRIINSFPEGNPIRTELEERFEEAKRSYPRPNLGRDALVVLDDIVGRVFDEGER